MFRLYISCRIKEILISISIQTYLAFKWRILLKNERGPGVCSSKSSCCVSDKIARRYALTVRFKYKPYDVNGFIDLWVSSFIVIFLIVIISSLWVVIEYEHDTYSIYVHCDGEVLLIGPLYTRGRRINSAAISLFYILSGKVNSKWRK